MIADETFCRYKRKTQKKKNYVKNVQLFIRDRVNAFTRVHTSRPTNNNNGKNRKIEEKRKKEKNQKIKRTKKERNKRSFFSFKKGIVRETLT